MADLDKVQANIIPANMRAFVQHLAGRTDPVTEDFFPEGDLELLRRSVLMKMDQDGTTRGAIGYGWYGDMDSQSLYQFDQGELNLARVAMRSFRDPVFRLETTLGMSNYEVDKSGDIIVTDKYNFNYVTSKDRAERIVAGIPSEPANIVTSGPGAYLRMIAAAFGAAEDEPGTPVRINLGRAPDEWADIATSPVQDRPRTQLSGMEEHYFRAWYERLARANEMNANPDDVRHRYDYRGWWKKERPENWRDANDPHFWGPDLTVRDEDGFVHGPDEFRDEDHPTFPGRRVAEN